MRLIARRRQTDRRIPMSHRRFAFMGALAAAIAAVAWLVTVPVAGHTPAAAPKTQTTASAKAWTLPRTPWGAPDLNGVWTNATTTPWERPKELAGKEFLTDEEVAARDKQVE